MTAHHARGIALAAVLVGISFPVLSLTAQDGVTQVRSQADQGIALAQYARGRS